MIDQQRDRLHSAVGGLQILPANWRTAIIAVLASVLGVAGFVVLLDAAIFRAALPADYVAFYTGPLWPRTLELCLAAAGEEILFRLGLMTLLAAALSWWRGSAPAPWMFVAIILAAQFANVGAQVAAEPAHASLRLWAVGRVWGWLYWRHGWLAALAGHGSVHLLLDPVLALALRG